MIRGSIDIITNKLVAGWIYSDTHKEPLSIEVVINDEVVEKASANLPRPDLAAAGFGDGKCGFEVRFKNEVGSLYLPFVQVRLAATDLELRRWAGAGFRDYFTALYQRYPHAGRSASVYGGFWTDRTDAAALLKGRTDIGIVDIEDANRLARFIQDGVILMSLERGAMASSVEKPGNGDLAATIAATVFDERLLRLLRAILDDHPVVVRVDRVTADEEEFLQMSAIEDLPSPAECLGIVFPVGRKSIYVDILRGGHRFPEFRPDGLSRWSHANALKATKSLLSPDTPIDRQLVPPGGAMVISSGALCRVLVATGTSLRVLVLPARLSLLRFFRQGPAGELTHESGARIWI